MLSYALAHSPALQRLVRGRRVVELGAGAHGAAGLAAAFVCDCDVIVTDKPAALAALRANVVANQGRLLGRCSAEALDWGCSLQESALWGTAEAIVAADVLWTPEVAEAFGRAAVAAARAPKRDVAVLVCHEVRPASARAMEALRQVAGIAGLDKLDATHYHPEWRAPGEIEILQLRLA